MESSDSHVEPEKRLADLGEGDIVVLTTDPGCKFLGKPTIEKTARITLKLSHSFTVDHKRFSISSGKELYQVSAGQWRVVQDGWFISVPTAEQLEKLPDPEGNYTDAQIRAMREKAISSVLREVKAYLDLDSPEYRQRILTLQFFLGDESKQETLLWAYGEIVENLKSENNELKSKLKQLSILFDTAQTLVAKYRLETLS